MYVEPLLDWKVGEMVGIAATNMRTHDYDECTITAYDSATGKVTCKNNFKGYHFGQDESTEEEYGVDMRAEVWMMNRNVRVFASTEEIGFVLQETWGGQVLVSDFREPNDVKRQGVLNMDNVQVYNCSQKMTYKSAIRFE
jgi:cold shock CspA family protein